MKSASRTFGISPDALLSKADIALYAAKADGRRVWRAFEPAMDAKIQIRRLIELELRAAVASDGIDVHFQPIVAVGTGRIVGFEALARWQSAVLGSISPTEFIPIVEEIGLMEEMGAAVLRRACSACAAWPDGVSVSVNLSPTQFRNGNLEKTILGALAAANLAPERLDLEITELTLLEDRGDTRRALQALRARGLRISLDDFGTGYSSLSIGQLYQQTQLHGRGARPRVCNRATVPARRMNLSRLSARRTALEVFVAKELPMRPCRSMS